MSLKIVIFQRNEEYIRKFIDFPDKLYKGVWRTQNKKTELDLFHGTHCLSGNFEVWGILVLTKEEQPLARCMVTCYEGDDYAFFGFFECCKNHEVCHRLMETAKRLVTQLGRRTLIGPVDASFWIKYRLKTNHFEKPYTAEPYNLDYYPKLLQAEGFTVWKEYVSNQYRIAGKDYENARHLARLEERLAEGYEIKSPNKENFEEYMREFYRLLTDLYKDFPVYKYITGQQFFNLFSDFKKALVLDMVKLAYKDGKMVGFLIAIPNYGNLLAGGLSATRIPHLLRTRKKPLEYIVLYLDADPLYLGVESMLTTCAQKEFKDRGCSSVGALKQKDMAGVDGFADLVIYTNEYALYRCELEAD